MSKLMVTNNPLIYSYYHQNWDVEYDSTADYLEVLQKGLNKVLEGYKLINHPLYSNLRTSETPYRTLLMVSKTNFDVASYRVLEKAVETVTSQLNSKQPPKYKECIYEDYQLIDADLISHMVDS